MEEIDPRIESSLELRSMANSVARRILLQLPLSMHEAPALLMSSGGALRDKRIPNSNSQLSANIAQDDEWNIAARRKMKLVVQGPPSACEHLRVALGKCEDGRLRQRFSETILSVSLHCLSCKVLIVLSEGIDSEFRIWLLIYVNDLLPKLPRL
jgi:hypothetical protein